ncbi:MAG: helix-turn-helix domain-containing protein [Planctomycetes bacterium]|nr:helix-turn-helix domain-containing protein [Planctomycetota bacterium]
MNAKRKNILLVLKEQRPTVFETILKHGHMMHWSIEYYPAEIPKNWYGDGAIVDYISPQEIARLPKGTPIATRSSIIADNIFPVRADTEYNMAMVFNFFRSRGYRNYAVANAHPMLYDPVTVIGRMAKEAGYNYDFIYWNLVGKKVMKEDFTRCIKVIGEWLLQLPKPCALYIGRIRSVHLVYRACEQVGVSIPKDVAIVSNTDDPEYGVNLLPSISVMSDNHEGAAIKMVEGLDGLINGKPAPRQIQLIRSDRIVARGSTDAYAVEHPATMQAIDYILSNYSNPQLTLQDITRAAGCTAVTLQRNFAKYLRRLPSSFLQEVRLEGAAAMLEKTTLNLQEIAQNVGYGSNMSLSLAFKSRFGMAPGQYRKNLNRVNRK